MSARIGSMRISKRDWDALGGLSHPQLWRRHNGRNWVYYRKFY